MFRALRGEPEPAQPFLYWEFYGHGFQQAVRMGEWKAVRSSPRRHLELYNLQTDPGEQRDVAAAHPEVVSRIEDYLLTARTESPLWPVPGIWRSWAGWALRNALALFAISSLACVGLLVRRAFLRRSQAPRR
jgi:arylsulfatase A-like enzyme